MWRNFNYFIGNRTIVDFTEVMNLLKNASPYDLYRIRVALKNEMENPVKIKEVRQRFAVGDQVSYFDSTTNSLIFAVTLEKNLKNAVLKNLHDQRVWNIPYYMINLTGNESDIHATPKEKLTKNNLKIGDSVGFNNDGKPCFGNITRLNHKTASIVTKENKCWRVSYGLLFKILEGDLANELPDISRSLEKITEPE